MNKPELIARLTAWQATHQDVKNRLAELYDLLGTSGESPFIDSIYRLMENDTNKLSDIVGCDVETLNWFEIECDLGKSPHRASPPGGELRLVDNIEKLADLIGWDAT